MNNSDFLSDAVALDLGKSGVKVAETLEIEVGEEWWRLINAADATDATTFYNRRFIDPIVVGDEILLNNTIQEQGIIYPMYSEGKSFNVYQKAAAVAIVGEDKKPIYCFYGHKRTDAYGGAFTLGQYPILRVQQEDGTVLGVYNPSVNMQKVQFLFWDSVNSRFLAVSHNGSTFSRIVGINANGTGIAGGTTSGTYEPSLDVRSFIEKSGYAYSLFYSGGYLYFKETEITLDVNLVTLGQSTINFAAASCVKISVAENTGGIGWLFFSRAFNSVGVMWKDSGTGLVRYALQSESFATAYTFPDLTFSGSKTIESVGNFIIPQEGEFLIVKTRSIPSGVLTRPVGWSYPANFSIVGTAEVAENTGIILGKVGTTLYRLEVNLTTMTIVKVWSVSLTYEPTTTTSLAYAKNGREIYVVNVNTPANHMQCSYMIFCLDTTEESLVWCFGSPLGTDNTYGVTFSGDWVGGGVWPSVTGYNNSVYVSFFRLGNNAVFWRNWYDYPGGGVYKKNSCVVDIDALAACNSIAAVKALMTATSITTTTITTRQYITTHASGPTHSIYDDVYHYMVNVAGSDSGYYNLPCFSNATFTVSEYKRYGRGLTALYSGPSLYVSFLPFGFVAPGHTYTIWGNYEETDGVLVAHMAEAANATNSSYYNLDVDAVAIYTQNGTLQSRAALGFVASSHSLTYKRYFSPLDEKYSRLIFNGNGTTFCIEGCSFLPALTTCAGYAERFTLPFTYALGIQGTCSKKFYAISSVVDGDISWAQFHAKEGVERTIYAVRASDLSEIYTIKGIEVSGGWADAKFQGRIITGVTGTGKTIAIDLDASDTEGYGEGGGGTGGESLYIYQYVSRSYIPYPFAREGIRAELSNISKTTKITLPETQGNLIRGMLAAGTDFRGSRCILRRVFPDHIDEPGADIVLLDGYIQDWSYVPGKKGIAFSVSKTLIDVGAQFPKRLMNMGCSHVFKGERCRYLGETGRCLKTKAFCTSLGNINQFGGFPWVAARQRRVMWK